MGIRSVMRYLQEKHKINYFPQGRVCPSECTSGTTHGGHVAPGPITAILLIQLNILVLRFPRLEFSVQVRLSRMIHVEC
jgi:hypothetical protein